MIQLYVSIIEFERIKTINSYICISIYIYEVDMLIIFNKI